MKICMAIKNSFLIVPLVSPPLITKVISTYEVFKPTDVELIFGNKTLTPIEENINANQVGWRETNKYWVDDSNFVWKSIQSISPRLPKIY